MSLLGKYEYGERPTECDNFFVGNHKYLVSWGLLLRRTGVPFGSDVKPPVVGIQNQARDWIMLWLAIFFEVIGLLLMKYYGNIPIEAIFIALGVVVLWDSGCAVLFHKFNSGVSDWYQANVWLARARIGKYETDATDISENKSRADADKGEQSIRRRRFISVFFAVGIIVVAALKCWIFYGIVKQRIDVTTIFVSSMYVVTAVIHLTFSGQALAAAMATVRWNQAIREVISKNEKKEVIPAPTINPFSFMVNMDGMPSDMERLRVRHGQKAIVEIRCNRAFSRDADGKSIEGSYELIFFDVPTDREVFTLISGIKGNATEIQRTVAAYCLTVQLAHSGLFKEGNK